MPFIGKENLVGSYALLDSISPNGSASYTMQIDGINFEPETPRNMIVSVNGVTQAPVTAYTVSGSTITFAEALQSSDEIDYILILGNVLDVGVPSDNTVGSSQLKTNAVTTTKITDGAVTAAKLTIDGDLVPSANVTYDLGSDTLRFKDLYLSGNTIVLGDHTFSANDTHVSIGDFTVSNTGAVSGDGSSLTALNASQLTSGTIPNARFPSALPAIDGSALTGIESLPASIYSDNADANTIVVNADGMTLTGSLVVTGNLQIDGTTTTINSTTLTVDDKNIVLASGAASAAAADGAGITVDGASATLTYNSTGDRWSFNKSVQISGDLTVASGNFTSRGIDDNSAVTLLTLSSAGQVTVDGDLIVASGTNDFNVASHDGGTVGLKLAGTLVTATAAELNYVDGVTSNIQTQLNAKAPTASPTFTGSATFDTNTLYVDATNDRVGVGTTSPTSHLHVKTSTTGNSDGESTLALERPSTSYENAIQYITNGVKQWFVGSDNDTTENIIWYNWVAAATRMTLTTGGNLTIAGTFTESSAMRYKENIQDLEYNNIISQLKPKIYNKIGQEEQEVGLIAEDVEALDKTLVTYQEDGTVEGIKYTRLVPHLIAHIQKLEERLARIEHGNT